MRIALFTEAYLPYLNGVVTHVKILKEGLEELGHEVLVVTADARTNRHFIKDGVLYCPAAQIKKLYDYSVARPISRRRLKLLDAFDPDVIHIHNEFGIGLFGVLAARSLRVPLVHTLHTMYDDYIYYVAPKPLTNVTKRVTYRYARFLAGRAQVLTSPSTKAVGYYELAGVKKPVHIIPNSVETDIFSPSAATSEEKLALRRQYGIPEEATVAIFVGRIGKEKSIDVLLEIWKQQCAEDERLFLVIVGDGPFLEEYKALAETLEIPNVVFTGRIPHDALPPYLCMADVYVSASTSEMHSISMLEGMASGLPVLQRRDPENQEQIKGGKNGYIFETAEEMGERLREIAAMSPGQKMMLKKSVAATVADQNSTEIARFMLDIYALAAGELEKETAARLAARAEAIRYGSPGITEPGEDPMVDTLE